MLPLFNMTFSPLPFPTSANKHLEIISSWTSSSVYRLRTYSSGPALISRHLLHAGLPAAASYSGEAGSKPGPFWARLCAGGTPRGASLCRSGRRALKGRSHDGNRWMGTSLARLLAVWERVKKSFFKFLIFRSYNDKICPKRQVLVFPSSPFH